jgi:hypothetical protein
MCWLRSGTLTRGTSSAAGCLIVPFATSSASQRYSKKSKEPVDSFRLFCDFIVKLTTNFQLLAEHRKPEISSVDVDATPNHSSVAAILSDKVVALRPEAIPDRVRSHVEELLIDVIGLCVASMVLRYTGRTSTTRSRAGPFTRVPSSSRRCLLHAKGSGEMRARRCSEL